MYIYISYLSYINDYDYFAAFILLNLDLLLAFMVTKFDYKCFQCII